MKTIAEDFGGAVLVWVLTATLLIWTAGCGPDRGEVVRDAVQLEQIPIPVSLSCDFPTDLAPIAEEAFAWWNAQAPRELFTLQPCTPKGSGIAGILVLFGDAPPAGDDFAVGMYTAIEGKMVGGQILFFTLWRALDGDGRASVARHEVGHVLGFQHVPDQGCLMYPYQDNGWGDRSLCAAELDTLEGL